jgi:hypothetical protein
MATRAPDEFKPKARSDAYTGMLLLSLIVLIAGCVLIYLDFSQYPTSKPKSVPSKASAISNPLGPGGGGAPKGGQPGKAAPK